MTRPTAAECADFRTRLAAAEAAYHDLIVGGKTVRVGFDGKQVEYTPAKSGDLARYLEWLRQKVRECDGKARNARSMFGVIPTN